MANPIDKRFVFNGVAFLLAFFAIADADLRLPDGMEQDVYCTGCKATVEALEKFHEKNPKSIDYDQACLTKYFTENDNKLWQNLRSCNHLLDFYEEGIQKRFGKLKKEEFRAWLCYDKTYACIGVYSGSKHGEKPRVGMSDDELVRDLLEKYKDRIRTPHPPTKKDEL